MRRLALLLGLAIAACSNPDRPGVDTSTTNPPPSGNGHDWPRFGYDESRSGSSDAPATLTAAQLPTLQRQQVSIDGTIDASAIYLNGVQVNGGVHNVFFVTTSYGKTLAIDADNGAVLWRFTPPNYTTWAGS